MLIPDLHLGVRNDSPVFQDYIRRSLDWVMTEIDARNIRHVIQLGDLVDRRKYINYTSASILRKSFLEPLEARQIETHIISGNHDHFNRDSHVVNSLDELVGNRYSCIKTYTMPTLVTVAGLDIQLLPWMTESNRTASMKAVEKSTAKILMGHLELRNFPVYKGILMEHGGDDGAAFRHFDMVFSGHYHHISSNGNVHYLGAFAEFTWSDYNDPRGIHVFDTETFACDFLKNPHCMFKMIHYDDKDDKNILKKVKAMDYEQYRECYIKIVCANRTNGFAFDAMMDNLYKAEPADIAIVEDLVSISENSDEAVDESSDTPTILSTYIRSLTLPVPTDRMETYMREVYTEAISTEHV